MSSAIHTRQTIPFLMFTYVVSDISVEVHNIMNRVCFARGYLLETNIYIYIQYMAI